MSALSSTSTLATASTARKRHTTHFKSAGPHAPSGADAPADAQHAQILQVQEFLRRHREGRPIPPHLATTWRQFHAEMSETIRRFAASHGLWGGPLEDCVQETWISLLMQLPSLNFDPRQGRLETWLYQIVQSRAADQLRTHYRHNHAPLDMAHASDQLVGAPAPGALLEAAEFRSQVAQFLAVLRERVSETSYQVFHLRRIEGLSVQEVAQQTGLAPPQVRARSYRVEKKLRSFADSEPPNPVDRNSRP